MATRRMPRRNFFKGAASTVAVASLAPGLRLPAAAQSAATRPADLVLKNGKIITIDGPSTITPAVAMTGDRIVAASRSVCAWPALEDLIRSGHLKLEPLSAEAKELFFEIDERQPHWWPR
jgi:hypothetical protein